MRAVSPSPTVWCSLAIGALTALVGTVGCRSPGSTAQGARPGPSATPAARVASTSPFPLAIGNRWFYRESRKNPRTGESETNDVTLAVASEERSGFRIVEERNGKASNNFVLVEDGAGIHHYEFESSPDPQLLFPKKIEAAGQWEISKVSRARVVRETEADVSGQTIRCFEVLFERFYGKDWTDDPGWFADGTFWVAPGVGIVKKDLSHARRPPSRDRAAPARTWGELGAVWELVRFELKS